jgi:hypothetical protein
MTELEQRRRVGHRLHAQVDAGKGAHGLTIIDRIFEGLVGRRLPLLENVNA